MTKYIIVDVFELDEQATAQTVEKVKNRVAGTSNPDDWTHTEDEIVGRSKDYTTEEVKTFEQAKEVLAKNQFKVVERD